MVGVPQSSYLSPLLFVAYINEMLTLPESYLDLFADDTLIHCTRISTNPAANKLQKQLKLLISWYDE